MEKGKRKREKVKERENDRERKRGEQRERRKEQGKPGRKGIDRVKKCRDRQTDGRSDGAVWFAGGHVNHVEVYRVDGRRRLHQGLSYREILQRL